MELYELKLVLEDLYSVGIKSVVLDPNNDGDGTLVRASDKDGKVAVYCDSEFSFSDKTIAIQDVSSILSRVNLFDVNKATVEITDNDDYVLELKIKQGRKKTRFRCAPPEALQVPSRVPGDLTIKDGECVVLQRDYVSYITDVISSLSKTVSDTPANVAIEIKDDNLNVTISDGETDSFSDTLVEIGVDDRDKSYWDAIPFSKVIRQSIRESEEAKFIISKDHGLAVFAVGTVDVIVVPSV